MQDIKKLKQTLTHAELSEEVKGAVHLVTAWKWDRPRQEAMFWLRDNVVETILNVRDDYS